MTQPSTTGAKPGRSARHVVVMGVAGTGKTTVGRQLADLLGWDFVEGDDRHSPANIAKMSAGVPLDDDDRAPWLASLSRLLATHHASGVSSVLTCSALKRRYRDVLRAGPADDSAVFFLHLTAPYDVLRARLESRAHFMPARLLDSQLAALEPLEADEQGAVVDVSQPLVDVVAAAVAVVGPD